MPKQIYVSWLHEITPDQAEWIGRKASRLAELINADIPVPKGFVIFPQAFFRFLASSGLKSKLQSQISSIDYYNPTDLEMASRRIRTLIMNCQIPKEIALPVFDLVAKFGNRQSVAIRGSSSHSAFSTTHQEPKLGVKGDAAILDGIRQVWSEFLSPKNIQAIIQHSLVDYPFSVIVEQMVDSQVGGVVFTSAPSGVEKSRIYLNAAFGIRNEYIKRYNYPDLYVVDAFSLDILEKTVTAQSKALLETDRGVIESPISQSQGRQQKLTDPQIISLAKIAKKIQNLYFYPQKVEFSLSHNQLFILDTQPIGVTDHLFYPQENSTQPSSQLIQIARGTTISPGLAVGPVRFITQISHLSQVKTGDIVVLPDPGLLRHLPFKQLAGLIIESASTTDIDVIFCKNLGLPSVISSFDIAPKSGKTITLDATTGFIYLGSTKSTSTGANDFYQASLKTDSPVISAKLYAALTDPAELHGLNPDSWSGIGMLRTEQLLSACKYSPADFFSHPKSDSLTKLLDLYLEIASTCQDKPLILRLNDPLPDFGSANSINRGAIVYQAYHHPLETELSVIAKLLNKVPDLKLHLVIPFVRSQEEILNFFKIFHQTVPVSASVKLFSMIETPSSALTISQILKLPLEGVVVGLNDLTAFTLAIDRNDPHIQAIYHQSHPAVLKLLEIIIKAVLLSRKQIYISGEGIIDYYDVLEKCLSLGATNLCVPVKRLPAFISEVSACELKIARNSHG